MGIVTSVDGLVGGTPVFSFAERGAEVLVKLESYNPGGSVKDRAALAIIEQAEASGVLKPGGVIVEPTSGNMGVALAMLGVSRGYRVIIVMPDTMTLERRKLITAFGGELVLTEGALRMTGAMRKAEELARSIPGAFMPGQFENPANPDANEAAGREILKDTEGRLDAFVAGIGTGGSFTGTARVLKQALPSILCAALEPAESAVISGGHPGPHGIQGIGSGFIPKNFDRSLADRIIPVPTSAAMATACWFTKTFGILAGISSGAAVYAARRLARELGPGKRVLCLAPDTGERYLSILYTK
ncbi:cysteine synthase A [Ethanoligenens harbinense]|uniref:Cysteine synthase n=1 Tax=Ethanoligenens harbinense (strain DSM 18485 / JCM 12961 / CGMCC 1.5033 / YUAN-3) TaxID=663278 RepID=E6U4A8_ETHHY|nr:cysteine synthase A [Ethanoligenens harbinense]ADU26608.1 cysteine synthase A [Ethanoligenens harbinense YUAN-3]AVQ95733.1 cysteine synthase A [Ethanoligenens harbinense YUAN-3]AYF38396.1 cysteine synthase A [Ethanoligenens harbinense]AYF41141.1 cysteine synthase A [Ethanoligenens harbinense]QCN91972.1 cysteine synthase A [Ethanoligenens harbinense]